MNTNYRKINISNKQIQIEYSNDNKKESTPNSKIIIPRRIVHVLNKTAIQKMAIQDRLYATTEWVNKQRDMVKFENYERVKYPETIAHMDIDDEASVMDENSNCSSKYSFSDESGEYMTYALMLMLLATCCLLKNV